MGSCGMAAVADGWSASGANHFSASSSIRSSSMSAEIDRMAFDGW